MHSRASDCHAAGRVSPRVRRAAPFLPLRTRRLEHHKIESQVLPPGMRGIQAPQAHFDVIVVGGPRVVRAEDLAGKGIRVTMVFILQLPGLTLDRSRGAMRGMEVQAPDREGE